MGRPGSTHAKRQREQARQERSQEKAARRVAKKDDEGRPESMDGEDPDIAGIVPGPQPPREEDDL